MLPDGADGPVVFADGQRQDAQGKTGRHKETHLPAQEGDVFPCQGDHHFPGNFKAPCKDDAEDADPEENAWKPGCEAAGADTEKEYRKTVHHCHGKGKALRYPGAAFFLCGLPFLLLRKMLKNTLDMKFILADIGV